ncbi:Sir2 family NAD-dependent protein deacetylase [Gallaecimonas xiamenensis]|uniref:protein acetyllysine N-acetyltransferase n=1 Tax=Gallaecimonas xiamenensis 3-C-1 TaxID=745411 RepID=K2J475_9GAMM|nr:Sir2 family NAD-dependent protein deacetylase [Gallaecimonas xiamenensis]EKE77831.1 hypothetical protein B3C1_00185 [Gallaecimonas xiamenensis 3-C-1]
MDGSKRKVVVFSGAGLSADSGLDTFRDQGGLWHQVPVALVATPEGWQQDPAFVTAFYNDRRRDIAKAQPNAAHLAIARLEQRFEVTVITQNLDDLHERAGSSRVLHLHGEITKARSLAAPGQLYEIGYRDLGAEERDAAGGLLRPHVVWFGEAPLAMDEALAAIKVADKVLVVGTSLIVQPAASLLKKARYQADKRIVALDINSKPFGYRFIRGRAANVVPAIACDWLA